MVITISTDSRGVSTSALATQPRLLLLDEATEGIQPTIVAVIRQKVEDINRERSVAVLLVEQHVQLALTVADRGYILSHGELVAADSAERLRGDGALLAASYLGEQPLDPE